MTPKDHIFESDINVGDLVFVSNSNDKQIFLAKVIELRDNNRIKVFLIRYNGDHKYELQKHYSYIYKHRQYVKANLNIIIDE